MTFKILEIEHMVTYLFVSYTTNCFLKETKIFHFSPLFGRCRTIYVQGFVMVVLIGTLRASIVKKCTVKYVLAGTRR
jgi:hypothetical protein